MRARFGLVVALALSTGIAGAARAVTTEYECQFKEGQDVPTVVFIRKDEKAGTTMVYDPFIKHYIGKPILATELPGSAARTSFTWRLNADSKTNRGDDRVSFTFRFSYFNNGTPATITVSPSGYDNTWSGKGTCKVKKG